LSSNSQFVHIKLHRSTLLTDKLYLFSLKMGELKLYQYQFDQIINYIFQVAIFLF